MCPAHPAPHTFLALGIEGVLETVAAVGNGRRRHVSYLLRVRGAGTGLEPSLGHGRSRIPAMASSQGDVRSSPMAYQAVRPLPKLGENTIFPQFWGYFSPIHIADILYIYLLILCKKENIAIYSEHWTNGDDMEKTLIYY